MAINHTIFKTIRSVEDMVSEDVPDLTLKLEENGQFPDESVKIKDVQIHRVGVL